MADQLKVRIDVTKADLREALCRTFLLTEKRWLEMEALARRIAAERRLKAIVDRMGEIARVPLEPFDKWRAAQDEFDRISEEHDALLDAAYPRRQEGGA